MNKSNEEVQKKWDYRIISSKDFVAGKSNHALSLYAFTTATFFFALKWTTACKIMDFFHKNWDYVFFSVGKEGD